jgi:hypothetical protein
MPGEAIPAIRWGTFYDRNGVAHIAPTINEFLMEGHKLSAACACNPLAEQMKHITIMIHYVIH